MFFNWWLQWNPFWEATLEELPTPLEGPHVDVNFNMKVLISTPDEKPPLSWGQISGAKGMAPQEGFHCIFLSIYTIYWHIHCKTLTRFDVYIYLPLKPNTYKYEIYTKAYHFRWHDWAVCIRRPRRYRWLPPVADGLRWANNHQTGTHCICGHVPKARRKINSKSQEKGRQIHHRRYNFSL